MVTLVTFRPFPNEELVDALSRARDVVVIEKALDAGMGGPLATNVLNALRAVARPPKLHSVIAGLGGRPITKAALRDSSPARWCSPGSARISSISTSASSAASCTAAPRHAASAARPRAS